MIMHMTPSRFRLLVGVLLGGLILFVFVGSGVAGYVLAYLGTGFVFESTEAAERAGLVGAVLGSSAGLWQAVKGLRR